MIYVYREKSKSAQALYEAIKDEGAQVTRLRHVGDANPSKGDMVVNWGACLDWPYWPGVTILNKRTLGDKLTEIKRLTSAGVPCFEYSLSKPSSGGVWLPRRRMHHEGNDLLDKEGYADFYTLKENLVKELRFHVFKGKVIQVQFKKAVKENAHPWIRSWATGWDWKNGGDTTPAMYKAAVEAVAACGLDMGAVDVGVKPHGFVVIEVNTAPGFDVGGVTCYKWANAIIEENKE